MEYGISDRFFGWKRTIARPGHFEISQPTARFSLLAIILIGAALRFHRLGFNSLWGDEAVQLYEDALEIDPSLRRPHAVLSSFYWDRRDCTKTLEHRERLAELTPSNGTFASLGDTYWECGKIDQAIQSYEKAVEIDPTLPRTHFALARAYAEHGSVAEAVKQYQLVIELDNAGSLAERAQQWLADYASASTE